MTCKFCDKTGHLSIVTLPAFDGKKLKATIEICDDDAALLRRVQK